MVLAHRSAVIHGIESRNLIHTHRGHFQEASDLVHDADGAESVLALAEVEKGHHGRLLVLRGVPLQDRVDDSLVLGREREGDAGVVLGGIAVLRGGVMLAIVMSLLIVSCLNLW